MVWTGSFEDGRPWWPVAVAGPRDLIPHGMWAHNPAADPFLQPRAADVRRHLDDLLWKKRASHRVCVYYPGDDCGLRYVIEAYCAGRKVARQPMFEERDVWGAQAPFRRDLLTIARVAAVVWFGPLAGAEWDLVSLAIWHNVPYRVVPLEE